ncbi:hypothetical protein Rhopal_007176-T1 [Rhodotorula paludigena]|uniref:YTH domain-containing protein n=1 Tax=Rhodotorula paludigena TaxID=86838 RepID=A0AAV5GYJ6_9BASI|nr:hypothetical protein Rhopal_007176-T1 [Rhodotorula paludigena]
MTHMQHLSHTGYPPSTYPYGLPNNAPYQFPPQVASAPASATRPPVVFSHPFLPRASPSVPMSPHSLDPSPPASIQQRASTAGSEGQQLFYPISSARSSVTSSVPSWPSDPNVQQGRSASVSQVHASPVHPVVAGGLPSAFAASPQDSVFPAQLPRPPASGPSRHSSETRTSVASPTSAGPAPSPLNPLGSNKSSPTGPGVSPGYAPSPVRGTAHGRRRDLPRPPVHSPHALWVGNVPSDASHAELWQFFQTRPTPAMCGKALSPSELHVDLDVNGVESIHLIARSNCAFVNYLSSTHLYHAIDVSNGVALRPDDPRCKKLICRVRHQGDDSRSGVGAQRQGGMHKAFVREQQVRMAESQREIRDEVASRRESRESSVSPGIAISPSPLASPVGRTERERSLASVGSSSTTSSFLTKHFERRYFILKSHDEADLRKSVETGVWATQTHNEPVLQQAFRTARSVYIIFGANGTGCWFGYARMVGPIGEATSSGRSSLPSAGSRDALSSTSTEMRFSSAATILEEPEQLEGAASPAAARRPLISPSEHRYADSSPLGLTPSSANSYAGRVLAGLPATRSTSQSGQSTPQGATGGDGGHGNRESAPASHPTGHIPLSAQREMAREQDLIARETADKLHLPPEAAEAARRAASLGSSVPPATGGGKVVPKERGAKSLEDRSKHDVVAKAAEARNAKLEKIEATMESQTKNSPGTDANQNLPFPRTRHIRNSFNGNREIKVSRDGTEVEPVAGELLLNEFWRTDSGSPSEVPLRPASPQPPFEAPSPRDELAAATAAAPNAQHEAASPSHKVEAKAASA